MNIFSKRGDKIYSITSPYSSYDNKELKFETEKTTINIFNGEEIKYIVNSDESTLSKNNLVCCPINFSVYSTQRPCNRTCGFSFDVISG